MGRTGFCIFWFSLWVTSSCFGLETDSLWKAERLFSEGLFSDAVPYYEAYLKENRPGCERATITLAICYYHEERFEDILDLFAHDKPDSNRHETAIYLQAVALRKLGRFREALSVLNQHPIKNGELEKKFNAWELERESLENIDAKALLEAEESYRLGMEQWNQGLLDRAWDAFAQAESLFQPISAKKTAICRQAQVRTLLEKGGQAHIERAWKIASDLAATTILEGSRQKELYLLTGETALAAAPFNPALLEEAANLFQSLPAEPEVLKSLGFIYLSQNQPARAEALFADISTQFADSPSYHPLLQEVLMGRAACAAKLGNERLRQHHLKCVFETYPTAPLAASAYFDYYSLSAYMQGRKKAIKHLEAFTTLFPESPLGILSFYLIGLDQLKDRYSEERKLIRKRDWIAAIDAFTKTESTFERFLQQGLIPAVHLSYFEEIRYLANLERGSAHFGIAAESEGAKKAIYIKYAQDVLKELIERLSKDNHFEIIARKARFRLAQALLKEGRNEEAEACLNQLIAFSTSRDYLLAQTWCLKGKILKKLKKPEKALEAFFSSENSVEPTILSPDERLDLWIQQSLCYRHMQNYPESMKLLSRAVNEEAISPLRIKALFLRGEIYLLEGRRELALKQFQAAAKKGGRWGKKAKDKLDGLEHSE